MGSKDENGKCQNGNIRVSEGRRKCNWCLCFYLFVYPFLFSVLAVFNKHVGGDCPRDQSHNWVLLEFF